MPRSYPPQYPYLCGRELSLPELINTALRSGGSSGSSQGQVTDGDMRGISGLIKQITLYVPEVMGGMPVTDCPGCDDNDAVNTQARVECSKVD
jgi:hypothetical protein